ncbi:endonuclease/exonuclease/phosphatase family protein [Alteribacillus sp. YIM 98480]|uniref:endonuclease/exonuclease/phosphatase family protein n=1 Tax=Alteribacillus sp. YIM 98480 TaxID=2606599 RepID=UPI001E5EB288|nr:endonuclease/exonuclease/phosphatase family protein [Alteribacillus sp. YIM 98480]
MEIKVMTYNIHHGKGMDKQMDLNRIAEVIQKSDVDMVGLNEVDKHFSKRSHYQDQVDELAKKLNMYQSYGPAISLKSKNTMVKRQYGNALLSRFPILHTKTYFFHFIPWLTEGRSLLDAEIQINKKVIQVNVTHLSLHPFIHNRQTNFIMNQWKKKTRPLIIMGDCNMKPGSRGWKKINRQFQDVWHAAGSGEGHTYSSIRPRYRLDYIFTSPELHIIDAEVVTAMPMASDHFPLKTTLFI